MRLEEIIIDCDVVEIHGDVAIEVTGVCFDSRKVKPGDLFIAVKGAACDGHEFIDSAIEKGAVAVIYEDKEI